MNGKVNSVLTYPVSVVTGATEINVTKAVARATGPDMAFDSSLGLEDTRIPSGSIGHSDLYGPSRSTVLGYEYGPR